MACATAHAAPDSPKAKAVTQKSSSKKPSNSSKNTVKKPASKENTSNQNKTLAKPIEILYEKVDVTENEAGTSKKAEPAKESAPAEDAAPAKKTAPTKETEPTKETAPVKKSAPSKNSEQKKDSTSKKDTKAQKKVSETNEANPETPDSTKKEPLHGVIENVKPEKINMAKNMLDRVENIKLIDTLRVDSADFFRRYRLSSDVGQLLNASILPKEYRDDNPHVVFRTQNGKELFWSQPADSGKRIIVTSDILDNGLMDTARPLSPLLNDGDGDSDYPFVMQDGLTIYFANNGDNSLGGYDIFMTRRSPTGEVLQPQNIGMPFNSPFNDFMMVIDETRDLGWWASDREQIPGKLTLYIFEPSKIRVNYSPDLPNIEDLAMIYNITPLGHLEDRMIDPVTIQKTKPIEFNIVINGKTYTQLNQLTNPQAREAMTEYLALNVEKQAIDKRLPQLRAAYENGNVNVKDEIINMEKRKLSLPIEMQRLSNKVISLESQKQ